MKLRSHQVARSAYQGVQRWQEFKKKKEYGALAHKLPVMILQNGLSQATGFLLAKANSGDAQNEHGALLDDLAQVFRESDFFDVARDVTCDVVCESGGALHELVLAANMMETMRITRRALEASAWLRRYVQGVLKVDASGQTQDESTQQVGAASV
ncbi:MAG: type III-B CRISPR module-associated protein Cmr5 [Gammaproteobacteria bacterium]